MPVVEAYLREGVSPRSWRLRLVLLTLALRLNDQRRNGFRRGYSRLVIFVVFVDELLHDYILPYEVRERGVGF